MAVRFFLKKAGILKEVHARESVLLAEVIKSSGLVGSEFSQCGFSLECGTCAVRIIPEIEEAEVEEEMVLRSVGRNTTYRCSCQVKVTSALESATIEIP